MEKTASENMLLPAIVRLIIATYMHGLKTWKQNINNINKCYSRVIYQMLRERGNADYRVVLYLFFSQRGFQLPK